MPGKVLTASLSLLAVLATAAEGQILRGRVSDADTRVPVSQTRVMLLELDSTLVADAIAADDGRYIIAPGREGKFLVAAERIGYKRLVMGPVELKHGEFTDAQIRISPTAVVLDGLVVAVEAQLQSLDRVGYYDRRRRGLGKFLDPKQISERNAVLLTDLMRGMVGVRVMPVRTGGEVVVMRSGMSSRGTAQGGAFCTPSVWLDGTRMFAFDWRSIHPDDVAAIEVYRSAAEVPAQYGGAMAGCGVVLIWTLAW